MAETAQSIGREEQTKTIAREHGLMPDTSMYRWLHPAMVCGIEDGKLLLSGHNKNGIRVIDKYGPNKEERHASKLPNPGLNFTKAYSTNYKTESRRTGISMKMKDQSKDLQVYPDEGSEVPSVYFTIPKDTYFKVTAESFDPMEVALAITMHDFMKELNITEEPAYRNWSEAEGGLRVSTYLPKPEGGEQLVEVPFLKEENNSYRMDTSGIQLSQNKEALEKLAYYRFLIDNKDFTSITLPDGTVYKKEEILQDVQESPQFAQTKTLHK